MIVRRRACFTARRGRIAGFQWHQGTIRPIHGNEAMRLDMQTLQTTKPASSRALDASAWRDLARLAAEALAIGIAFSVLLALAVFMVARAGNSADASLRADAPPQVRVRIA
jgi:hypothetical protein